MEKKIGTEVVFSTPIRKSYQIETENVDLAICMALDMAQNRYPSKDFSNPSYKCFPYNVENGSRTAISPIRIQDSQR